MRGLTLADPALVGVAASSFNPLTLSPTLWLKGNGTFWQDAARTTPAVADNDPIGSWEDASGVGNHAVSSLTARPLLKLGILNGIAVARFDGVNDILTAPLAATETQTHVLVLKTAAPTAAYKTNMALVGTAQLYTNSVTGTGYNYYHNQASAEVAGTGTPANWNIVSLTYTSLAAANLRVGGGAGTAFDPSNAWATATSVTLGANVTPNQWASMDCAENLRFGSALSLADLNSVGQYLASKYALTWTEAT